MNYQINFLPEALNDIKKLDHSVRPQVAKGIQKVSQNPVSIYQGGYGKPLGNKDGSNLAGLFKIKFRGIGIRVVYSIEERNSVMTIIVVSVRADHQVYQEASHRRTKHDL
ncbi:MAG: type II toxin-antitoxin system RelE/ParE family toxin [Clostridium sp.]|jgi:mRNA interferase RelE/StbE|nr:type II toxin-antitoxin system RelE/ParE family toxin [Clostridium sp.]